MSNYIQFRLFRPMPIKINKVGQCSTAFSHISYFSKNFITRTHFPLAYQDELEVGYKNNFYY